MKGIKIMDKLLTTITALNTYELLTKQQKKDLRTFLEKTSQWI